MIKSIDLAAEMAEEHDITVDAAREGVDTFLGQVNYIDRTDYDTEVTDEVADTIRDQFEATYGNPF